MIKFRLSYLIILINQIAFAQTMVFGYLKGLEGKPLSKADITLGEDRALHAESDQVGYFQFKNLTKGTYLIIVTKTGYVPTSFTFTVSPGELKKDLGEISLEYNPSQIDVGIITLTDSDLSANVSSISGQTGIGLLQSSQDVFSRTAAFELGPYWFKVRGIDNQYNNIMFNGVPMSKSRTGRTDFGNWGGLNNVIKYPYELAENNTVSDYAFSNLGGTTYYDTRASNYIKGLNLSYSFTDKKYQHRVMATYSTGMLSSGWAFTFSGSRRWMEEGVVDGTYNNSYAYFASAEKKISDKHRINITTFGAPSRKAGSSPNTQEVYDLRGKNYNAYWGWQDGDRRNERIRRSFEPVFMLSHYWDINNKTKLTTTASYQFGYNKESRLNRYRADNPSPTYYKNLPSYWKAKDNISEYNELLSYWQNNDPLITQINWSELYDVNRNSPYYSDPYSNQQGRRATYFLVDDVIKDKTFNLATHLQTQFADNWKFYVNVNYQNLVSDNYRQVNDLLGADFVVNKNSFLKGDGSATSIDDYNILKPGSVARKGDKTEYDYKLHRQELTANFTTRVSINRWDMSASTLIGWNESYRDGKYMHGLYAGNSYGESRKVSFVDLGLRAGITYKLNGRNFITVNTSYFESSPTLDEIFPNARLNNDLSPNSTKQKINANDITYTLRSPFVKARITGFYTKIQAAMEVLRYYAQGIGLGGGNDAFITEILSGVEKDFLGTELGVEWNITSTVVLSGIASIGQYTYKNNPDLHILSDLSAINMNYGKSYLKNYKQAATPQKGYSLGIKYNSPKYWWVGVSGNFLQDIYTDISGLSRTMNFILSDINDPDSVYPGATEESVRNLLKQKKYKDVFMLNANIGKSFRLGKYSMGVSASVNNLLNERGYVTQSFEQGRNTNYQEMISQPYFANSKLFYDQGRSYFLNIYLKL